VEALGASLRQLGAEPFCCPVYGLKHCSDAPGWARFHKLAASGGWCLFSSETEVQFFADALIRHGLDLRALGKFKVAAFGRGTETALRQRHMRADKIFQSKQGKPIQVNNSSRLNLVVFAEDIPVDAKKWKAVVRLKLFRIKSASWESHWIHEVRDNPPDFILFRNAAEVDGLVAVLGREATRDLSQKCRIIAKAEKTEAAVRRHGLTIGTGTADFKDLPVSCRF
jgi:uroporphyrinogen-III synthase